MQKIKRRFPVGIVVLCALVLNLIVITVLRFTNGIGFISSMSDGRPWGLWVSFDLYCGVALASGGFTLAALVYVFGREKYEPVIRPAILTAFLGYFLYFLALILDLGQPWYLFRFFIHPNVHSPMFEVALCVMTYMCVLLLEFSPVILEFLKEWNFPVIKKIKWEIPLKTVRKIQMPLIIAGIVISTLHQSTLGTMLLFMESTLHPLWYSTWLPVLFFITAVAVGPAMVLFEAAVSGKLLGHSFDLKLYQGLSRIFAGALIVYLLVKTGELVFAGEIDLLFTSGYYSVLWWAETLVGAVIPVGMLLVRKVRNSKRLIFWCATLVVAGLIINRFNVSLLALQMRPGYSYFPHWMEISVSAGIVAFGMLIIWIAYKYLPMHKKELAHSGRLSTTASFRQGSFRPILRPPSSSRTARSLARR